MEVSRQAAGQSVLSRRAGWPSTGASDAVCDLAAKLLDHRRNAHEDRHPSIT